MPLVWKPTQEKVYIRELVEGKYKIISKTIYACVDRAGEKRILKKDGTYNKNFKVVEKKSKSLSPIENKPKNKSLSPIKISLKEAIKIVTKLAKICLPYLEIESSAVITYDPITQIALYEAYGEIYGDSDLYAIDKVKVNLKTKLVTIIKKGNEEDAIDANQLIFNIKTYIISVTNDNNILLEST